MLGRRPPGLRVVFVLSLLVSGGIGFCSVPVVPYRSICADASALGSLPVRAPGQLGDTFAPMPARLLAARLSLATGTPIGLRTGPAGDARLLVPLAGLFRMESEERRRRRAAVEAEWARTLATGQWSSVLPRSWPDVVPGYRPDTWASLRPSRRECRFLAALAAAAEPTVASRRGRVQRAAR